MKKIISMVIFTGMVLLSPMVMSNITVSQPAYNPKEIKTEYYIIERDYRSEGYHEKPNVQTEKSEITEAPSINIPPTTNSVETTDITIELEPRYSPTPNEKKLMAALAWREDHTSVESMMAVLEVVLNPDF